MANLQDIAIVLKRLGVVYGQNLNGEQARLYQTALSSFSWIELYGGMLDVISNNRWMPKPSELRHAIMARRAKCGYWQPKHAEDERAMRLMFVKGYSSPDELTEAEVREIYQDETN